MPGTASTATNSPAGRQLPAAAKVVVCGGGVGAVETLLALRALAGEAPELHLVAPNTHFVHQPLSVAAPFDLAETSLFGLAELARDTNAQLHAQAVERIDAEQRQAVLASGERLDYDVLVVAVGARRREWLPGALHFGGAADVDAMRELVGRLDRGDAGRLAFAKPPASSWSLPLYELALLTAWHLADAGVVGVELSVVTDESEPMEAFGEPAGRLLRGLLADRGIALKTGAFVRSFEHGVLRCEPGSSLEADQVVALATLEGPAVSGLPTDAAGFIVTDDRGRVEDLEGVYAVGDGASFPVKQGGIAAEHADLVAEEIASKMGVAIIATAPAPTLHGTLLTGLAPLYLRTQLASAGSAAEVAGKPLWWPPEKIAGRYLAPYLALMAPHERRRMT